MPNFFDKYPYTDFHELNLDWIIKTVKETVAEWAVTLTEWHNTQEEWQQLYNYVHDYFDNLNVQEEVNTKINTMIADGTFVQITTPVIEAKVASMTPGLVSADLPGVVSDQIGNVVASQIGATVADQIDAPVALATAEWLNDHITQPSTPPIDTSLTVAGAAADAKSTGDAVAQAKNEINALVNDAVTLNREAMVIEYNNAGKYINFTGQEAAVSGANHSDQLSLTDNDKAYGFVFTGSTWYAVAAMVFFDSNDTVVKTVPDIALSGQENYSDIYVEVPLNASYVIVNDLHGISGTLTAPTVKRVESVSINIPVVNVSDMNTELQNSFTPIWNEEALVFNHSGSYIEFDGDIASFANTNYSQNIDCSSHDVKLIRFTGAAWSGVPAIVFFDSGDTVVGTYPLVPAMSGANYDNVEISVPINASYMIVNNVHGVSAIYNVPQLSFVSQYVTKIWNGLKWYCLGDSLTEQNDRTSMHYYDYVSNMTGIVPIIDGVSGSGYARGSETSNAFYQRILNIDTTADVITIFGSFNDIASGLPYGSVNDSGIDTICGCINTTLDNLFSVMPLANVGIVSPTPWTGTYPGEYNGEQYCKCLKDITTKRGIPYYDLFHTSSLRPWDATYRSLAYSHDGGSGVHPDETGHKIIAPRFEDFLYSLILS